MISEKNQVDIYTLVCFCRIANDYASMILQSPEIATKAKENLSYIKQATEFFYKRIVANISSPEGRAAFEREWQRDYLAWAAIFDSLLRMTDRQITGVEFFCDQLLSGKIKLIDDETEAPTEPPQGQAPGNGNNDQHGQELDPGAS